MMMMMMIDEEKVHRLVAAMRAGLVTLREAADRLMVLLILADGENPQASCRACGIPLPADTPGDHADTCEGCRQHLR